MLAQGSNCRPCFFRVGKYSSTLRGLKRDLDLFLGLNHHLVGKYSSTLRGLKHGRPRQHCSCSRSAVGKYSSTPRGSASPYVGVDVLGCVGEAHSGAVPPTPHTHYAPRPQHHLSRTAACLPQTPIPAHPNVSTPRGLASPCVGVDVWGCVGKARSGAVPPMPHALRTTHHGHDVTSRA